MTTVSRSSTLASRFRAPVRRCRRPDPGTGHARARPTTDTRPATTTFFGDTGIWFVPTAEVLPDGKWSASVYRRGTNWIQGYTNVADFAGTFAYGMKDRAEIFGSFLVDTRIDRDLRPIFVNDPTFGGIIDRYPQVNRTGPATTSATSIVGAKFNFWSESRQNPAAIARARHRQAADRQDGRRRQHRQGRTSRFDLIVSKEAAKLVEVSGFGGYEFRGSPDGFDTPTGAFRWGTGVAFPSRNLAAHRRRAERRSCRRRTPRRSPARRSSASTADACAADLEHREPHARHARPDAPGEEGLLRRRRRQLERADRGALGLVHRRARRHRRLLRHAVPHRLSPGRAGLRAAAAAAAAARAAGAGAGSTAPTVKARAAIRARSKSARRRRSPPTVQDSIGCAVTYRWTAPTGTLRAAGRAADALDRADAGRAGAGHRHRDLPERQQDGVGHGQRSRSIRAAAGRRAARSKTSTSTSTALAAARSDAPARRSDRAMLQANPTLKHRDRRAHLQHRHGRVQPGARRPAREQRCKDYLTSARRRRPTACERVSYGEERPKYDNAREETRRLNRRAALVVNLR